MKFQSPERLIEIVQNMKLFDLPRSKNRSLIDKLANGFPPWSNNEVNENRIEVNFNDLSMTKLLHDARGQFNNALLSPANFFQVRLDSGAKHKRQEWSEIITTEINRQMKRNRVYAETLRDVIRQLVLHGVGPVIWKDRHSWVPQMQMIGDVMFPSRTLVTLENVQYFAVYRRYTAAQLWRMTHGPKVDPAWNVPLAEACIEWASHQWGATYGDNDYIYTPENWQEDIKADQGWAATDMLPTIDCWDFWYLNDDDKQWGWSRRVVLDTPSGSEAGQGGNYRGKPISSVKGVKDSFLYNSEKRKYAQNLDEIVHIQFADGAVFAPARYHSVRSLGFLLYSVCHIQNRLRCRYTAHAFENLLQYFRVSNPADSERLTKLDLVNLGVIPDGLNFVRQEERWQVNEGLIASVLQMNRQSMSDQSVAYTQNYDYLQDKREKTATQVMAEVNAASSLVSAMLNDAYEYQEWQYREIARRFCIKNSADMEVRKFRTNCLKNGVPEEMLNSDLWDVRAEKIMGGGNRQLAIAQSQLVMENYPLLDPDAQRVALRNRMFAVTGDSALTNLLVPEQRTQVTQSTHDAELSATRMLDGLPMGLKQGVNHAEYAASLLASMGAVIQQVEARGGMATPKEVIGLQNIAGQDIAGRTIPGNGVIHHLNILAQDKNAKPIVRQLSDQLGNAMNMVKAYVERLSEQQASTNGNGSAEANGIAMEAQAKQQAMLLQAQTKSEIQKAQAAEKMRLKDAQFQQKAQQDQERHQLEMANTLRATEVDEASKDIQTAADIRRQAMQPPGGET